MIRIGIIKAKISNFIENYIKIIVLLRKGELLSLLKIGRRDRGRGASPLLVVPKGLEPIFGGYLLYSLSA